MAFRWNPLDVNGNRRGIILDAAAPPWLSSCSLQPAASRNSGWAAANPFKLFSRLENMRVGLAPLTQLCRRKYVIIHSPVALASSTGR